jgi:hypothetical protein
MLWGTICPKTCTICPEHAQSAPERDPSTLHRTTLALLKPKEAIGGAFSTCVAIPVGCASRACYLHPRLSIVGA